MADEKIEMKETVTEDVSVEVRTVAPSPEKKETIFNMKCRRGGCESITAKVVPIPSHNRRIYCCTECNYSWEVEVGGSLVDLNQL